MLVQVQVQEQLSKYITGSRQSTDSSAIKLEGAFTGKEMDSLEEIFLSKVLSKPGAGRRQGAGRQGARKIWRR